VQHANHNANFYSPNNGRRGLQGKNIQNHRNNKTTYTQHKAASVKTVPTWWTRQLKKSISNVKTLSRIR